MNHHERYLSQLPHGEPFRFVTTLESIDPGVAACGQWQVSGDEDFLQGHFPGRPIVPGVLIAEALAQLSGIVAVSGEQSGGNQGMLAHTDIRFRSMVEPPASLVLHSRQQRVLGTIGQFDVRAELDGRVAAEGTLAIARSREE